MATLPIALRPSNGRPYGLLLHQNTIGLCLGLHSDLDSEPPCFYWFVRLHEYFFFQHSGFFSFSFFLIPLFSDRFQWIEQDNAVPVVFAFHVIAFAHFVIFTDFRNSKRILQLDDFIRIN